MHWSNGGLTPYNMYDGWLDSALARPVIKRPATSRD